jgi:hypothetical protein
MLTHIAAGIAAYAIFIFGVAAFAPENDYWGSVRTGVCITSLLGACVSLAIYALGA